MRIFCMPRGGLGGSEAVYSLLRYAVFTMHNTGLPQIEKTPNGKPYFPEKPDIQFSLSHSATHVLCAVSSSPVGADIESPRKISERAVRYFCSKEELEHFEPLSLWVLKESFIKLKGATLPAVKTLRFSRGTGGVIVSPDPAVTAKLYRIADCRAAICSPELELPDIIEIVSPEQLCNIY